MIYCVECQLKGWGHQEVNSGLVQELAGICKEPVCVIAADSHISVLKQYQYAKDIRWQSYHTEYSLAGDGNGYGDYAYFISRLLHKNKLKSGDHVFFLSSNRELLLVLTLLAPMYVDVTFYCVMHAILEKVIDNGMMEEQNRIFTLKNAIRLLAVNKNINIIGYSPYTKRYLTEILPSKALQQVFFLHHPVEKEKLPKRKTAEPKMRIALIGAAANVKGIHIIKKVLEQSNSSDFEFNILDRGNMQQAFHDGRVNSVRKTAGFDEREIRGVINSADWLLIPYDHTKYQISASGILADAIRYEKPVFALDSPYIRYYNDRYRIGYVEETEEKLVEQICEVIRGRDENRYGFFADNLKRMSEEMKIYNKTVLEKMIRGNGQGNKKCKVSVLAGFTAWFLLKEYGKKSAVKNNSLKIRADKNASVIAVLNHLFMAVQDHKDIAGFLKAKGYHRVAIYGMGNVGCRLYDELKNSDIEVMYGIDTKAPDKLRDLKVVTITEIYEEPDIIIITPVFYYSDICAELGKKVHCELVSIEDLLNGLE